MDDADFLARFEAATIPSAEWTHQAHVRMAFLYVRALPLEEAIARIRAGIKRLNVANGVVDSDTGGYHESITVAWAHVVRATLRWGDPATFAELAAANPHLLATSLLRLYYTRERIMSVAARRGFVEPDVTPLPGA